MRATPGRDRLAVSTYQEAGEEIPNGDPSVTDAERAAAGRETLGERFEALLSGNRNRAAAQCAAAGLPDGQDMVPVWRPRPGRHEEWIGGHDQVWWEQQLPVALGWLLRA